jgi:hypothetical protein
MSRGRDGVNPRTDALAVGREAKKDEGRVNA